MIPKKFVGIAKQVYPIFTINAFISAFSAKRDAAFIFDGETHDFWEMVYLKDGYAYAEADDQLCPLSAGWLIFHKPLEFHKIYSIGKPFETVIISFDADGSIMRLLENRLFFLTDKQKNKLNLIFHKARSLLYSCEGDDISPEDLPLYIQETSLLLQLFLIELIKNNNDYQIVAHSKNERIYREILNIMSDNCHTNLKMSDIATKCGLSTSNLKKIFAEFNDTSIMKYFLHLRIRRSMHLLDQNMSISAISEMLSFPNPNYFAVIFKRETGYTPSQYKNRSKPSCVLIGR